MVDGGLDVFPEVLDGGVEALVKEEGELIEFGAEDAGLFVESVRIVSKWKEVGISNARLTFSRAAKSGAEAL